MRYVITEAECDRHGVKFTLDEICVISKAYDGKTEFQIVAAGGQGAVLASMDRLIDGLMRIRNSISHVPPQDYARVMSDPRPSSKPLDEEA